MNLISLNDLWIKLQFALYYTLHKNTNYIKPNIFNYITIQCIVLMANLFNIALWAYITKNRSTSLTKCANLLFLLFLFL